MKNIMVILTGITCTTHIDKHYERMAKSALEDMAKQINEKFIPFLDNHDFKKQIGVILYAEVFRLNDGEYALGSIAGLFENEKEKQRIALGKANILSREYQNLLNKQELIELVATNQKNRGKENAKGNNPSIAKLLEIHLDSTKVLPDGQVYKIKRYITSTGDLQIHMYQNDHPPTHLHIKSKQRKFDIRLDINTLEPIRPKLGKIKNSDIRKIKNFFEVHSEILNKLKAGYHHGK